MARLNLMNVCPVCRVYDPTHFVHYRDCPFWKSTALDDVSLLVAIYRRDGIRIREKSVVTLNKWGRTLVLDEADA